MSDLNLPTELRDAALIIIPPERQRNAAKADQALIDSIAQDGQINPILIHSDGTLVAGERRLDACLSLNRPVRCTVMEQLRPDIAYRLELAENLHRKQLSWQEETRAIAGYHKMKLDTVGSMWTQMGTATDLGVSRSTVGRVLVVAESLDEPDVNGCPSFQGALNLLTNRAERATIAAQSRGLEVASSIALALPPQLPIGATKEERTAALLQSMDLNTEATSVVSDLSDDNDKTLNLIAAGKLADAALQVEHAKSRTDNMVVTADFLEWAADYVGPQFDVIHCDFPYGKGYKGSNTRRTGKAHINPLYADDPDIYFELVDGFLNLQDNFAFPAAHCLFWFDMMYYDWTCRRFAEAGWVLVQPFPLIWTKGYTGVAADPKRRPRHCYETALLFSRGDRKIVKLDNDHTECPLEDTKLHTSQKPMTMLKKFLGIIVDEHTALLDPTCGSGGSLAAALQLKANRVLGVELDPSNAEVARFLLQRKAPPEDLTAKGEALGIDGAQ